VIASANRLRSAGWFVLLGLCVALVLVLAFRVNALRSQIHHAEARIVALKQDKMYLETEFETRANQQQLKVWNDVEFGYAAPNASQYLEGERQLASLSMPTTADAPKPIRVASVDDAVIASAAFPAMVSPLSGKALASDDRKIASDDDAHAVRMGHDEAVVTLNDRLGKVVEVTPRKPVRQETVSEKERADPVRPAKKSEKKVAKASASSKSDKPKPTAVADKSSPKKGKSSSGTRPDKRKEAKAAG